MCYRACSNEQVIRQHMENKTIFFKKWLSTEPMDTRLVKSLNKAPVFFRRVQHFCFKRDAQCSVEMPNIIKISQ